MYSRLIYRFIITALFLPQTGPQFKKNHQSKKDCLVMKVFMGVKYTKNVKNVYYLNKIRILLSSWLNGGGTASVSLEKTRRILSTPH
jgi:hypothetical protein